MPVKVRGIVKQYCPSEICIDANRTWWLWGSKEKHSVKIKHNTICKKIRN